MTGKDSVRNGFYYDENFYKSLHDFANRNRQDKDSLVIAASLFGHGNNNKVSALKQLGITDGKILDMSGQENMHETPVEVLKEMPITIHADPNKMKESLESINKVLKEMENEASEEHKKFIPRASHESVTLNISKQLNERIERICEKYNGITKEDMIEQMIEYAIKNIEK